MKNKLIGVGDTHGRDTWKQVVQNESFNKFIFIGDYFDTHYDVTPEQQIQNFKDIIEFKKSNPDKVVLLIGNHDFHYMPCCTSIGEYYSEFQASHALEIQQLLEENRDLLQMCYVHNDILFSHAGVSKTWLSNNSNDILTPTQVENHINTLFKTNPRVFGFTPKRWGSNYGDCITQTPIWIRPDSLILDKLDEFTMVVGHTTANSLDISNKFGIIQIDTIGTSKEYLIIEDNEFKVGKL